MFFLLLVVTGDGRCTYYYSEWLQIYVNKIETSFFQCSDYVDWMMAKASSLQVACCSSLQKFSIKDQA